MEQQNRNTIVTVEPGKSSGEAAISLLETAVRALRNHPMDADAGLVAGRIVNYLKTFPTHAVVAYLVRNADGRATMHRIHPDTWPEWAKSPEGLSCLPDKAYTEEEGDAYTLGYVDGHDDALVGTPGVFDLVAHLERQRTFSLATFGPGTRTDGILDHLRKELAEVAAAPTDLSEWVDLVLLALDGAWRAGHEPLAIAQGIAAKQERNEGRTWPDWRTMDPGKAIEHDRTGGAP